MNNPLLKPSALPFGALPFHEIHDEHFAPAIEKGMELARSRIEALKAQSAPATFENTIEALEFAQEEVELASGVFSSLLHAHASEKLQELSKEIMPKLAAFSNDISLDAGLFERVRTVYENREKLGLDSEKAMLLERTYLFFARNGAFLSEEGKSKLREIDARLALLGEKFSENVLKSTNAFELYLTEPSEVAGLPESVREAAAKAAQEKRKKGAWLITLQAPSYIPFMKYSERRDLREKLWRAYETRATSGEHDNREVLKEIARFRFERARLMGYRDHADFVLKERMAGSEPTVRGFLERILGVSRAAAERELQELREFSGLKEVMRWDFAFWAEKLKSKKFGFNEEALRPYFRLENVVSGAFEHARRLYGLVFERRADLPAYHPDVETYEVRDEKTKRHIGLLYLDFFPRPTKQGGAWMAAFLEQGIFRGEVRRPWVSFVCNLTRPTDTRPSLLNLEEVRTIFHEFGHALHALLSECHYRSVSGTHVYWDFVELPSQIMENWVREKEGLDLFAAHYETGEKIPAETIEKIQEASRFLAGYGSVRQISFGLLDMAWHSGDPSQVRDVEQHEKKALAQAALFPDVPGTQFSTGFSHIFAGGYSAGYYSYKWAEVLEADAFELFKEKGIFNPEVSRKFRDEILSRGGTEHPMTLFKRFRGREPDPQALLRREGLLGSEELLSD